MEKLARKKSSDPAQEALRQEKDNWNRSVSALIAGLIVLKKGFNGRGDARVGLPPSSIKEPLPGQIGEYLSHIVDDFQQVVHDGKNIIEHQSQYSQNRRHSIKQASWFGSRLYSQIKLLSLKKEERRLRLRMLKAGVSLNKELKQFEKIISNYQQGESVPNAVSDLTGLLHMFLGDFYTTYLRYKELVTPQEETKNPIDEKPKLEIVPEQPSAQYIIQDQSAAEVVIRYLIGKVESDQKELLTAYLKDFQSQVADVGQKPTETQIKELEEIYSIILKYATDQLGPAESFEQLLPKINIKQAAISTMWNSWLLSMKRDSVSRIRLDIIENSSLARSALNQVLNALENPTSTPENFQTGLNKLVSQFIKIIEQILAMGNIYQAEIRRKHREKDFYLKDIRPADLSKLKELRRQLQPLLDISD